MKSNVKRLSGLFLILTSLALCMCEASELRPNESVDADGDSDSDTDGDSDSDSDSDGDTDGDTDSNSDTDTDTDTDGDSDSDSDTDSDSDSDTDDESGISVEITSPEANYVTETGTEIVFEGTVGDTAYAASDLTVEWISDVDGVLATGTPESDGSVSLTVDTLSVGYHIVELEVTNPDSQSKFDTVNVGICEWGTPDVFDFDIEGTSWKTYGDAFFHEDGYLEITDNLPNRKGAIFDIAEKINPGNVSISFDIMTGPNVGTGADGFAMSVVDVEDQTALETYIAATYPGCGLGYGVYDTMDINAFHIEIDTWHNIDNGTTELHTDPTDENHIAVTLDGDPGTHYMWTEVPNIEDMLWHTVTIDIDQSTVIVTLDENEVMNEEIEGFLFRGGYLGFTGSTGYYTNYHRFDNLNVLDECIVPNE